MSKQGCKGLLPPSSLTNGDDRQNVHFIAHYGHRPTVGCAICVPPIPVLRLLANEVELRIPSLRRRRWDGRESYRARWRKGGEGCLYRTSPLPLPPSPHPPLPRRKLWFSFLLSSPASCWLLLLAISQLLPPPPLSPVRPPLRAAQSEEDKWQQFGGGRSERGGKRLWGGGAAVGSSQKRFSGGWRSAEEGGGRGKRTKKPRQKQVGEKREEGKWALLPTQLAQFFCL